MEVPYSFMTCPGIEPGFTPWEGVVLTAWPTGRNRGDKIRTCDLCVPNAALYQTEPRLDVLERLFCAVYQRLIYIIMTQKKMQAFFWKNFNFSKKSFFGEFSGFGEIPAKPYFIRKNSDWKTLTAFVIFRDESGKQIGKHNFSIQWFSSASSHSFLRQIPIGESGITSWSFR